MPAAETDYLEAILNANVYDVAIETPLQEAPLLSARLGNRLFLKREDLQPVFSFKLRGAYNKMSRLSAAELRRGVVAASAGNHAQGVALAAARLGSRGDDRDAGDDAADQGRLGRGARRDRSCSRATPTTTPTPRRCASCAAASSTFVHPYDDVDVIAGQGTIAMEILRELREPIDTIFVAVGGGGLIGGIAAYVKRLRPEIRIVGVEPEDANAMERSLRAGRRITLPHVGLFADGVAVKQVGVEPFRLARRYVDDMILVDTDELCAAMKDVFEDTRAIVEPSAALGVAGAKRYVEQDGHQRPEPGDGALRREHELRPAPLRRRARRPRRGARGGLRGHDPGAARQLQGVLPAARPQQHHRVQLPLRRPGRGARVRRAERARPRREGQAPARRSTAPGSRPST